ncbi:MAG TPA: NAD-binding protein [Actinomycetota bacterium]|nr:NAD-binding protein [Actinomycetota bacterium]
MRVRYGPLQRAMIVVANNLAQGLVIGSLLAAGLLVVCGVLFFAFEAGANREVDHIGDGFLWVTRTLLQQEPPFEPATWVGTVLYYVVVITGVGIIAMVTGAIASKIVEVVMRKDAGMGRAAYSGHIVICGWSPQGDEIVRELHAPDVKDPRPVAIVARLASNPVEDDLVTFIRGTPNDAQALRRAGIERAETAIILADSSNPSAGPDERDAMTLLTTLAVESLNADVHTCVEVIRSENVAHFQRAKADELVVSAELTGNLLAASAITHGMSQVIEELTGHHGSEFYRVDAPPALRGVRFADALERVKVRADALLIGIASDGLRVDLNPPADRVIGKDDHLLVIAARDPSPRLEGWTG